MKDYVIKDNIIEITLENGKVVKCGKEWADNTMKKLELSTIDEAILVFLADNDYITNEEQEKLDAKAKGVIKLVAKAEKPKKKTQKERVQKENPTKELIIQTIAETLQKLDISNLNIENKAKIITFSMNNEDFKVDLIQKRKPKQ